MMRREGFRRKSITVFWKVNFAFLTSFTWPIISAFVRKWCHRDKGKRFLIPAAVVPRSYGDMFAMVRNAGAKCCPRPRIAILKSYYGICRTRSISFARAEQQQKQRDGTFTFVLKMRRKNVSIKKLRPRNCDQARRPSWRIDCSDETRCPSRTFFPLQNNV